MERKRRGIRITRDPWFGPKRHLGWGWRPITWQGWLVTALFAAAIVMVDIRVGRLVAIPSAIVIFLCFLVVIMLTGDPPGGPRSSR